MGAFLSRTHPAKFGGHKHWVSGYFLKSLCYIMLTHKISARRHSDLPGSSWSTLGNGHTFLHNDWRKTCKKFYQSIQKHRSEKRQSLGRLKRLCSEPSAQTHHPAEFNGHRSCKSREIVTWPYFGLVIKNHVNLKVDRRYWSGDMFLVCHVISQDHLIKGSCDEPLEVSKSPRCQVW